MSRGLGFGASVGASWFKGLEFGASQLGLHRTRYQWGTVEIDRFKSLGRWLRYSEMPTRLGV